MTKEPKLSKQELEIAMAACCVGTMWDEYEGTEDFDHMVRLRLNHLIELVRKSQPSLPSNLDEAAEKNFETMEVLEHENIFEETHRKIFKAGAEWMAEQGVSLSHLIAWYIQSVDAHDPVWTKEHLEELVKDYILIPKN